jgi:hypothetical protein
LDKTSCRIGASNRRRLPDKPAFYSVRLRRFAHDTSTRRETFSGVNELVNNLKTVRGNWDVTIYP